MRMQSPSRRTVLTSALASMAVGGCVNRFDVRRFRLNLEFIEEGRAYRGSSVRETFYTKDPSWFPSDGTPNLYARGEATGVPLSRGRVLFGMLYSHTTIAGPRRRTNAPLTPEGVLAERRLRQAEIVGPRVSNASQDYQTPSQPLPNVKAVGTRIPLTIEDLPQLVIFNYPDAPGSGLLFDPVALAEMAPGLCLGRCTIEITDDKINYGEAETLLPWLGGEPRYAAQAQEYAPGSTVFTDDFRI